MSLSGAWVRRLLRWLGPGAVANLAARLARTEKIDPKQLVNEAWDLYWESCRKIQADHREVNRMVAALDARDDEMWSEERGGLPQP